MSTANVIIEEVESVNLDTITVQEGFVIKDRVYMKLSMSHDPATFNAICLDPVELLVMDLNVSVTKVKLDIKATKL